MSTILTIAVHELRVMYRRSVFRILTLGLPIVALLALVVVWGVQSASKDEDQKIDKVGYVDGPELFTSHLAQGRLLFVAYASQEEGIEALLSEGVERLYVIPTDYLATGAVQRFDVGLGLNFDDGDDPGLRAFLLDNLSESAPDSDVIERLKQPVFLSRVALDPDGAPRDLDEPRVLFFLGLAFLFMLSLAMTGGFLLQGLGEEKESRIMEVLLSSVSPGQFLTGKVLGLATAGLSQILLWVVSARIILEILPSVLTDLDFALPGFAPTLLAVAFFVLGYLLFATLNAGVGAIAPTTQESQQLAIILAAPLIVPIWAWVYIAENPTSGVTQLLTFFPFTAPIVVLQRLGPDAIAGWEVALSLGLLVLTVAGAMLLAARIFRAFLLSYGKRPGLRVLWSALARR